MPATPPADAIRHDWTTAEAEALFALPFHELLFRAQSLHRQHFDPRRIQISSLLNIKTGGCAENCGYCSQSAHYDTALERERLMAVEEVVTAAREARDAGAGRYCMGAAWRRPNDRDMAVVLEMVRQVKALGMETCATLGMLSPAQVAQLKEAGLDYYNHNLDTSPEYYAQVVSTRTYQERLDTLAAVQEAGINVCAGGILGMGESRADRASLLVELARLDPHPQSVPLNLLIKVPGTPLAESPDLDVFEFVRTVAVARLLLPGSYVRLSAGREGMNDEAQALCFLAGANSIFYGERLLTADNSSASADHALLARLDLVAEA